MFCTQADGNPGCSMIPQDISQLHHSENRFPIHRANRKPETSMRGFLHPLSNLHLGTGGCRFCIILTKNRAVFIQTHNSGEIPLRYRCQSHLFAHEQRFNHIVPTPFHQHRSWCTHFAHHHDLPMFPSGPASFQLALRQFEPNWKGTS